MEAYNNVFSLNQNRHNVRMQYIEIQYFFSECTNNLKSDSKEGKMFTTCHAVTAVFQV